MTTPGERHLKGEREFVALGASQEASLGRRVFAYGRGCTLVDVDGREYVDLAAGTMTQSLGHSHPEVVEAVAAQVGALTNVHDNPTPQRLDAARALARLLPEHLGAMGFFTTGTEVVEAALRVAHASAESGRTRIAALRRGFHGKTRGARAAVQWDIGTEPPGPTLLGYPAYCYRCPFELTYPACDMLCARLTVKQTIARPDVAALLAEPIQGAAGVIVPPREYWEVVGKACAEHGVLLIADEVLTGGGRTGEFLASQHYGLAPDLVTLAKGLGSGHPVAVLAGRPDLLTEATWGSVGGYSSTFGGGPVGLTAATATLTVLHRDDLVTKVRELGLLLADELSAVADHPLVGEVRGLGLLHAVELAGPGRAPNPTAVDRVFRRALDMGVRVMPGGSVLRIAPPFLIEPDELVDAVRRLGRAIDQVYREDAS
ncbi:aspartate aminotransferase family protein [Allokutzneria albata]|uniref:4-aminobutyrate aminotransferase / (S)-3-amino-2-methylpropionate transaminase n=1 Tax=Allokutzneria albata TaxID=211114 RepID=A0A1G9R6W7_ALLAB|nr:aminotransferase class III-fold pyridoxal phosphate-dependent enzyme [Allokutzneria albata]SDM18973.1 4-aminobutyrate aminotransferase / (S)-3-amino-2-methylpropionate transaminase [Allokutzneria albata]